MANDKETKNDNDHSDKKEENENEELEDEELNNFSSSLSTTESDYQQLNLNPQGKGPSLTLNPRPDISQNTQKDLDLQNAVQLQLETDSVIAKILFDWIKSRKSTDVTPTFAQQLQMTNPKLDVYKPYIIGRGDTVTITSGMTREFGDNLVDITLKDGKLTLTGRGYTDPRKNPNKVLVDTARILAQKELELKQKQLEASGKTLTEEEKRKIFAYNIKNGPAKDIAQILIEMKKGDPSLTGILTKDAKSIVENELKNPKNLSQEEKDALNEALGKKPEKKEEADKKDQSESEASLTGRKKPGPG